jgi:CpeT protein
MLYTISKPLRFAGAWEKPELLTTITPDSLETTAGCSILLKKVAPGIFEGSTIGEGCLNNHMGANYTTSLLTVNSQKMVLWDKGFNSKGKLVWGAETKGYVFLKDGVE